MSTIPRRSPNSPEYQYESRKDLIAAVRACQRCPIVVPEKVFGEGPESANAVLIGEGPGLGEIRSGRPFHPRAVSGSILREAMDRAQFPATKAYITNVIHCRAVTRPGKNTWSRKADRPPSDEEVSNCSPFLYASLGFLKPKVILAVGDIAARALILFHHPDAVGLSLGQKRKEILRNGPFSTDWGPLYVTWHPSYISRSKGAATQLFDELVKDLVKVKRVAGIE